MRKSHLFAVFFLFLLVPASITRAQTISSQKGLTTAVFTTEYGNVKVYLPDDVRPGETISGTVMAEPKGNNTRQVEKNLAELVKYKVSIDGNKYTFADKQSVLKWLVPRNLQTSAPIELIETNGRSAGKLNYSTNIFEGETRFEGATTFSSGCVIPTHALTAAPVRITGRFDGDLATTKCLLNSQPMQVLTESPRECMALYPEAGQGQKTLQVNENGVEKCTRQISGVEMRVTTGDLDLRKGQKTYIEVSLTGLQHLPDTAILTLNNITAGTVSMQPSNSIIIPLAPVTVSSGTFIQRFDIQSIRTGSFTVNVDLDLPENLYDDHPPTQPQPGDQPQPKDTTVPQPPRWDTTTVAQCPGCKCSCTASIIFDAKKGDESTFRVEVKSSCTGTYGPPPCNECGIVDPYEYEWTVSFSADKPVTFAGSRNGPGVTLSNPLNGSYTLSVKITVMCNKGSTCTCNAVTRYLATNPPDIPGSCECSIDCKIKKGNPTCGEQVFTSAVTAECKGTGSKKDCKVKLIEYLWFLHSSQHGHVEIIGPANQPSVKIKISKPGKYTIYLKVTVTCTDGSKCTKICYSEEQADCLVDHKWCAGKPIDIIKYGEYPNSSGILEDMRPGETIALSVFARDEDNLLQYCGCEIETHIHQHLPTPDLVIYDWKIEQLAGGSGRIIRHGDPFSNSVLFQLPFCMESFPDSVRVTVTIKNAGEKADDEEVKVEYFIRMSLITFPQGAFTGRKISVAIESKVLNEPKAVICDQRAGPCVYSKHEWKKGKAATVITKITMTLPEENFPDNLVILSVEANDKDDLVVDCIHNGIISRKTISEIYDGFEINWSLKKGEGYFLLGDMGPSVVFQHKYGETNEVVIQCIIQQGTAQFNDLGEPVVLTIKIPARKKPVAFVGVGNIKHRVIKAMEHRELIRAAEKAVVKYEEAGYNVFTDFELTTASLERFYKNYICQAVLLIGHGDEFGLELFNEKDAFVHSSIRGWVREKWGCWSAQNVKHPSGRELIVLGCSLGKREGQWYEQYFNLEKFYGRKEWVWSSWAYSSIVSYIEKELAPLPPRILSPR